MELDDKQLEFFTEMDVTFNTPGWSMISRRWEDEITSIPERVFWGDQENIEKNTMEGRIRHELLTQLVQLPQAIARQKDELINMDAPSE